MTWLQPPPQTLCCDGPAVPRRCHFERTAQKGAGLPLSRACCCFLQLKTFNLAESKVIRDLNPGDINKLISVSGMVTRASTVIPDLQCASGPLESP